MTGPSLSRQLAKSIVDTLKRAGYLVLAGGESEAVLRDLGVHIDPVLDRILPRLSWRPVMGEVTSTFGDEATDEAVEQLVENLREALLDSDGVEDVYADDRTIERMIFRSLAEGLRTVGERIEEIEETAPPISVRLDTLGYVAAHAAKGADDEVLRDALDRAAEAVKSELERYDSNSRTAFFRPVDSDPDRRLDIEAAVEEELSDLVDFGVVDLPSVARRVELGRAIDRAEQKALTPDIDRLLKKHLSGGVYRGSWAFEGARTVALTLTPLAEPDERMVEAIASAFESEVRELAASSAAAPSSARDGAPSSKRDGSRQEAGATSVRGALDLARAIAAAKPAAKKPAAKKAGAPAEKAPKSAKPAPKDKPAAKKAASKPAPKSKRAK